METEELVEITFRCSDHAYSRLFRKLGDERQGDRLAAALTGLLDDEEAWPTIRLGKFKTPRGTMRNRKLRIPANLKRRFDALAATVPVSAELLVREAIHRYITRA